MDAAAGIDDGLSTERKTNLLFKEIYMINTRSFSEVLVILREEYISIDPNKSVK